MREMMNSFVFTIEGWITGSRGSKEPDVGALVMEVLDQAAWVYFAVNLGDCVHYRDWLILSA